MDVVSNLGESFLESVSNRGDVSNVVAYLNGLEVFCLTACFFGGGHKFKQWAAAAKIFRTGLGFYDRMFALSKGAVYKIAEIKGLEDQDNYEGATPTYVKALANYGVVSFSIILNGAIIPAAMLASTYEMLPGNGMFQLFHTYPNLKRLVTGLGWLGNGMAITFYAAKGYVEWQAMSEGVEKQKRLTGHGLDIIKYSGDLMSQLASHAGASKDLLLALKWGRVVGMLKPIIKNWPSNDSK